MYFYLNSLNRFISNRNQKIKSGTVFFNKNNSWS